MVVIRAGRKFGTVSGLRMLRGQRRGGPMQVRVTKSEKSDEPRTPPLPGPERPDEYEFDDWALI